MYNRSPVYR